MGSGGQPHGRFPRNTRMDARSRRAGARSSFARRPGGSEARSWSGLIAGTRSTRGRSNPLRAARPWGHTSHIRVGGIGARVFGLSPPAPASPSALPPCWALPVCSRAPVGPTGGGYVILYVRRCFGSACLYLSNVFFVVRFNASPPEYQNVKKSLSKQFRFGRRIFPRV